MSERPKTGAVETLDALRYRLLVQSGMEGDEGDGWEREHLIEGKMVDSVRYGDRVRIVWRNNEDDDYDAGYIFGLPGIEETDPEMGAVVHVPHPTGGRDSPPVFITLSDLLALPDVVRVDVEDGPIDRRGE